MASPSAYLETARTEGAVYIRVVGYGNFSVALPLREFTESLIGQGCRRVLVDLSPCESVDSTFMGVLAGLSASVGMGGPGGADSGGWVQAVNPNAHVSKLMDEIGLSRIVRVRQGTVEFPAVPLVRLDPKLGAPAVRLQTAAEAHRRLLPLDPANESRFRAVLQLLERELAAQQQKAAGR